MLSQAWDVLFITLGQILCVHIFNRVYNKFKQGTVQQEMAMQGRAGQARPGQGYLWSKCGHYYQHMKDNISKSPDSGLIITQQASLKCSHFVDGTYATEILQLSIQTHTSCQKFFEKLVSGIGQSFYFNSVLAVSVLLNIGTVHQDVS